MGDCQRSAGLLAGQTSLRRRQHPLPIAGRFGAQLRRDGRLPCPQIDGLALFQPMEINNKIFDLFHRSIPIFILLLVYIAILSILFLLYNR